MEPVPSAVPNREKAVIVIGGIKTDKFGLTSPDAEKNPIKIIVTPGNPGKRLNWLLIF